MENSIRIQTILGTLGLFVLTRPVKFFPWGDYYLDIRGVSKDTGLTRYEILQKLPVMWEKDNTML